MIHPSFRNAEHWVDIIHVVLCIVIVALAFFAFADPEENQMLFPLIFIFTAIVRLSSAVYLIIAGRKEKLISIPGVVDLIIGVAILVLGVVSAISVWR